MFAQIAQVRQLWRRITRTHQACVVESELARMRAENARLRDENRALLNSILGIAGIPPVYPTSAEDPRSILSPRAGSDVPASVPASPSATNGHAAGASQVNRLTESTNNSARLAPMRRRSWHQVNRALELRAARKRPEESTEE